MKDQLIHKIRYFGMLVGDAYRSIFLQLMMLLVHFVNNLSENEVEDLYGRLDTVWYHLKAIWEDYGDQFHESARETMSEPPQEVESLVDAIKQVSDAQ